MVDRKSTSTGTTLVEVIISIFLVALILTMVAELVTRYSLIIRHQEKKDRTIVNMKMALNTVTTEMEEALLIYVPDSAGSPPETEIKLWRYNPVQSLYKLDSRGGITVRYYLENRTLYREVDTGTKTAYPVAHEVYGFSVTRHNSRLYTVKVSLEESSRILLIEGKACLKTGI